MYVKQKMHLMSALLCLHEFDYVDQIRGAPEQVCDAFCQTLGVHNFGELFDLVDLYQWLLCTEESEAGEQLGGEIVRKIDSIQPVVLLNLMTQCHSVEENDSFAAQRLSIVHTLIEAKIDLWTYVLMSCAFLVAQRLLLPPELDRVYGQFAGTAFQPDSVQVLDFAVGCCIVDNTCVFVQNRHYEDVVGRFAAFARAGLTKLFQNSDVHQCQARRRCYHRVHTLFGRFPNMGFTDANL